jgi:hypothetical protein
MSSAEFLEQYRAAITALPLPGAASGIYAHTLGPGEGDILTTLLPLAAALHRRQPELRTRELIAEAQAASVGQIDRVLAAPQNRGNTG